MWRLTIVDDTGKKIVVALRPATYDIGRDQSNEIRLTEANVSRWHARMSWEGRRFLVDDLGSSHGTYVDRARVSFKTALAHGTELRIGDYVLYVEEIHSNTTDKRFDERVVRGVPRLVVVEGPAAGAAFPLLRKRTVVGSAESADVVLSHPSVAPSHCEVIARREGEFELRSLVSSRAEAREGKEPTAIVLHSGSRVCVGDVTLSFLAPGDPPYDSWSLPALTWTDAARIVTPYVLLLAIVGIGNAAFLLLK